MHNTPTQYIVIRKNFETLRHLVPHNNNHTYPTSGCTVMKQIGLWKYEEQNPAYEIIHQYTKKRYRANLSQAILMNTIEAISYQLNVI